MASSGISGPGRFGLGVMLRAAATGALAFGLLIAAERQLWATAAVLLVAIVILGLDLARAAMSADRLLARFVDGLISEGHERPAPQPALRKTARAIEHAMGRVAAVRAERERRIDHLEALIDSVAAALLVLDERGVVVAVNRAARQSLGAQPGPLLALAALSPASAVRLRSLPPGGREIVRLADGRAMLAQCATFLAAGRRQALVSLQRVAGELDAVELKAWQDLTRVLAHEMMNSLTPILSLSENLEARLRARGAKPAALAEDVAVIGRRSERLMRFVERYRRLADLPTPELAPVVAAELAGSLDRLMRPLMAEAGVDYVSEVRPRRLVLDVDRELIEQALINLLKNAIEATRGRPNAAVRLAIRQDEGQLILVVEDNGPGLPAGEPETVFVPFFTTKPGGSGVGLTLARQIALSHNGCLDYASRPDGGAVFRIRLPG